MRRLLLWACLLLAVALVSPLFAQSAGSTPANPSREPSLEQLAEAARKAQQDGLFPEAEKLYREGVALKSDWIEGWGNLGIILFDSDRPAEAAEAFRHLTRLQSENPDGWALLGLSDYQARQYDEALSCLARALSIGMPSSSKLAGLARIHAAYLLSREGRFDAALLTISGQVRIDAFNRRLEQAFGIAVLRLPYLPEEVPEQYRQTVAIAGKAAALASAEKLDEALPVFEELVREFPSVPQVHYAFGTFLIKVDPKAAIEQFRQELVVTPSHLGAHLRLAMTLWTEDQPEEALTYAQRAVELEPRSPAALTLLGRILLSEGQTEASIEKLEAAYALEPSSSEVLLALQRAYSRAGRQEDAARIREAFLQLQQQSQETSSRTPGSR